MRRAVKQIAELTLIVFIVIYCIVEMRSCIVTPDLKVSIGELTFIGRDYPPNDKSCEPMPKYCITTGSRLSIEAEVTLKPQDLLVNYDWAVKQNGGAITIPYRNAPIGYYTAPSQPGESMLILKVRYKRRKYEKGYLIKIVEANKIVPKRTLTSLEETNTDAPVALEVSIDNPKEDAQVPHETSVQGIVRKLNPGESLVLLVRPVVKGESWWVQEPPKVECKDCNDSPWISRPVYFGVLGDRELLFDLCVIITQKQLQRTEQHNILPDGEHACRRVQRM